MAGSLNKPIYASVAIALGLLCSLNVSAALLATEDLLSLSLEELLQLKITSSTLTDESLKTVPASVTLFTYAQIQQLGINTLEELMNYVPGYQSSRSDAGFTNYSSRSRRLSNSTCEVIVLLDGQRLDHDTFCGMSPTDGDFTLSNVARVEFLRGPGSSIYGTNALLGVVNIITEPNKNNAFISAGNNQQQRAAVNLSHQFDNGLHSAISAKVDNFETGKTQLFDPLAQSFVAAQPQQSQLQRLYWRASYGDWSLQARHMDKVVEDGYGIGNVTDDDAVLDSYSNLFSVNYTHDVSDQWALSSRIYHSRYSAGFHGRISTDPLFTTITFVGSESGIENHLTWKGAAANAVLGADFSRVSVTGSKVLIETPTSILSRTDTLENNNRDIKAIYGQWQNTLTERLSYIMGIRHDHYSDVTGRSSPRLGLIAQWSQENTFKLLYGEAFRVPSRVELYLKNNPAQMGNPDLDPEIAKTAELVWMHTHDTYYTSISLFNTEIENPVVLSNTPEPRPYINAGKEHMSGVEFESKWVLSHSLQLASTLSHIFNSPIKNNSEAENLASASLIYSAGKMAFSLSSRYHGKSRDEDNSSLGYHHLGGFTLFDAHAQYELTREWRIYGNIRNLTDKDYNQPAFQNSANIYGVPGTGREMEVGVSRSF